MKNRYALVAAAIFFAMPGFTQLSIDDGVLLERTVINSAGYKETKGPVMLEYSIGEMLAIRSVEKDTLMLSMGYLQNFDFKTASNPVIESELQVYPTLVTNFFTLKGRIDAATPFQLIIYDVQGRSIHQRRYMHAGGQVLQSVPTPFLKSGVYIVSIQISASISKPSETKTFRIIKL